MENLPTLVKILNSHAFIIQVGVVTGLSTGEVGRRGGELLFQEPNCRNRPTLTDEHWFDPAGRVDIRIPVISGLGSDWQCDRFLRRRGGEGGRGRHCGGGLRGAFARGFLAGGRGRCGCNNPLNVRGQTVG